MGVCSGSTSFSTVYTLSHIFDGLSREKIKNFRAKLKLFLVGSRGMEEAQNRCNVVFTLSIGELNGSNLKWPGDGWFIQGNNECWHKTI